MISKEAIVSEKDSKGSSISYGQIIAVTVVAIIVSGLIVRIVFALMDALKVLVEEVSDEDERDNYNRSSYYFLNAIFVFLICIFLIIIIYQIYVVGYLGSVDEKK